MEEEQYILKSPVSTGPLSIEVCSSKNIMRKDIDYQSEIHLIREKTKYLYSLIYYFGNGEIETTLNLCTLRVDGATSTEMAHIMDLKPLLSEDIGPTIKHPVFQYDSEKIYIGIDEMIYIFSVTGEEVPKYECALPISAFPVSVDQWLSSADLYIELPDIPDYSPIERLRARLNVYHSVETMSFDGKILIMIGPEVDVRVYRLMFLDENRARFQLVGHIYQSISELLLGYDVDSILIHNGFCYAIGGSGLTIYDIHDLTNPKRSGHYRVPDNWFHAIAPLPNGRVLLGGNNLHVIAPPR